MSTIDSLFIASRDFANLKPKTEQNQVTDIESEMANGNIKKVSNTVIRIPDNDPEMEKLIQKHYAGYEDLGIKLDDKMKKEIRDKYYNRLANPGDYQIIGTTMSLNELKRNTHIIEDKGSFESHKPQAM